MRETILQLNSESCILKVQDWAVESHLHTTQQKTTVINFQDNSPTAKAVKKYKRGHRTDYLITTK